MLHILYHLSEFESNSPLSNIVTPVVAFELTRLEMQLENSKLTQCICLVSGLHACIKANFGQRDCGQQALQDAPSTPPLRVPHRL